MAEEKKPAADEGAGSQEACCREGRRGEDHCREGDAAKAPAKAAAAKPRR